MALAILLVVVLFALVMMRVGRWAAAFPVTRWFLLGCLGVWMAGIPWFLTGRRPVMTAVWWFVSGMALLSVSTGWFARRREARR